jgi:hypothetical protein
MHIGAVSSEIKRSGSEADNTPLSSTQIKKAWSYTSSSPVRPQDMVGEIKASCYKRLVKNQPPAIVAPLATRLEPYWASAYSHSMVALQLVVL